MKEFVELIVPDVFHESILLSITKGMEKGWKKALMENTRDNKFQQSRGAGEGYINMRMLQRTENRDVLHRMPGGH